MIVWLASYPRSGNTFLRIILNSVFKIKTYSIYDDKFDIGADKKTKEIVGHEFLPKTFDIQKARESTITYYVKTHELHDDRISENDKVIYLIRDGRESTLSFNKYENSFSNQTKQLIDSIYGDTFIGSWGNHVESWSLNGRKNTLLIRFEELIKNPILFIEKIANFLGVKETSEKIPTFEELKAINPLFFRSGKTDSWKDVFTEEEHIAFWVKNYTQMIEYGYVHKMPDVFETSNNFVLIKEISNQSYYFMARLTGQQQTLRNKNEVVNIRNKQIDSQRKQLKNKQERLNKKNDIINTRNKQIDSKRQQLKDKQERLNKKNEVINTRNKQIDSKRQQLKDKQEKLNKKNDIINTRNKQIDSKRQQLKNKQQILNKKNNIINIRNKQIEGQKKQLKREKKIIFDKEQSLNKINYILDEIELLCNTSFFKSPLKKIKFYKKLLNKYKR